MSVIDTGQYTIVNVKQSNLAYLPDPNDGTPVAAFYERNVTNERVSLLLLPIGILLNPILPVERQQTEQWQLHHQECWPRHGRRSGQWC
jgi:hypothetical protein